MHPCAGPQHGHRGHDSFETKANTQKITMMKHIQKSSFTDDTPIS